MKRFRAAVSVILCLLLLTSVGAMPLTGYSSSADDGEFRVDGRTVSGFEEAMAASVSSGSPAVLMSDLTLAGEHIIPEGAVLQIPYDDDMTYCVEKPALADGAPVKVAPHRTLSLSSGAALNVEGTLAVSGSLTAAKSGQPCATTGSCGYMELSSDSELNILNGGSLFAWGRVTGEGRVNILEGAHVSETIQHDGYLSFSAFQRSLSEQDGVFSLSEYRINNIEALMSVCSGAEEKVFSYNERVPSRVMSVVSGYIGDKAFFDLDDGTVITKKYDPERDKTKIDIQGDVSIDRVFISPDGGSMNIVNTVFPICGADITVSLGALKSSLGLLILPGSSLTIDRGASAAMTGGLYAADAESWGDIKYLEETAGVINVNGELSADSSFGTASVGVISSGGCGSVYFGSDSAGAIRRAVPDGSVYRYEDIAVTSPDLSDRSGSALSTVGHSANTGYRATDGKWEKLINITLVLEGGAADSLTYARMGEAPAPATPASYRDSYYNYTFRKWSPALAPVTGEATYTALYYRSLRLDDGVRSRRRGDADGDAEVTILDATHIQRYLVGLDDDPHGIIEILGDADMDGELSILDATAIQRFLAGFENTTKINKLVVWSEPHDPTEALPPATEPQAQPTQPSETGTHQSPTTNYELPVL